MEKRTTKIHDTIYLQAEGDTFGDDEAVSWCSERINDSDIEYRRVKCGKSDHKDESK